QVSGPYLPALTKTLTEIQRVPEDEGYRKAVESFTRHRLKVCEEELGCGQLEELIEEAKDELTLIDKMIGASFCSSSLVAHVDGSDYQAQKQPQTQQ
ncbi:probable NADH dehydrogenase [ubiquinone] 1 alpha subcomplex subunit 5, mitochondrial, partial [Tanacetum coccineum]